MVFLRLTVKVYPREQTQSSSSFSIRSFLGDRDRDGSSQNSGPTAGKPASFLLVLENPEEVTMGGLAGMIREKWTKLRPGAEPLAIKKLVDDEHDTDDLDAELTVADVFVDNGRARTDGADQRGTVRVIQKPAPYAPVRFPSVTQDWDAAAQDFERQIKIKKEAVQANLRKIPTIAEESQSFPEQDTPSVQVNGGRTPAATADDEPRRDVPVSSVEHEEIPMSPPRWGESPVQGTDSQEPQGSAVAASSQQKRMESQELGESPSPEQQRTPSPKTQTVPAKRSSISKGSSASKRGSASKQVAATRSISQFVAEPDFPSSNQTERATSGSESPLSPRQAPSRQARELDEDEEVETETSQPERELDEEEEESDSMDKDGDVAMDDGDVAATEEATPEAAAKETDEPMVNGGRETSPRVEIPALRRKRKKSLEEEEPNKEPRLEPRSPGSSDKENNPSQSMSEPPLSSPSARRNERAPSFSGVGRRPSLSEKPTEFAKPGLGLGITKSPPAKQPVMLPLDSTVSISGTTPLFSSKASTIRRASLVDDATPSKQTPALDRVKVLHSALRKDSPADKSAQRRSVSFAEGEDVITSTPIPKSTTQTNPNDKGTPGSAASTGKKSSTPSKMAYPAGINQEQVEQLMREANQKFEKQHKDKAELEEMIRAAKQKDKDPAYMRKLEELSVILERVQKLEKRNRASEKERLERARKDLRKKRQEVAKMEASQDDNQPKADSSKTNEDANTPEADTAKAKASGKEPTPAAERNDSASKAAEAKKSREPSTTPTATEQNGPAKRAAEAKKGTEPSATPTTAERKGSTKKAPEARKGSDATATPTAAQPCPTEQEPRDTPNEPPESSAEDAKLPPVKKIQRGDLPKAKANGTKKSPASEPVDLSSTSSSSEESSENESENEDDNDTDAEAETQGTDKPAKSKADLLRRSSAAPSSQGTARSPAPSQSASQSWGQPINASRSRATLKTLLVDKKKESAEKAQQAKKKVGAAPKRPRNIFSPPSDDDTEESESSSSSSSSTSSSESESDAGGSDNESDSSADHGDIMSSGTVGKLRAARKK